MKEHETTSEKTGWPQILDWTIKIVAVVGAAYHLISTQFLFQTIIEHQNNHLAFSLVLVCLVLLKGKPKRWPSTLLLMGLGLVATGYVKIFFEELQGRIGFPTVPDLVIGVMLILVSLEASRRAFGLAIPILALIFICYDFLGHYLPDPLYHTRFTLSYVITHLSIGLDGMYGSALGASVNYIFLFFLYGGVLQNTRALEFFSELGKLAGRKLRGGPAQTAVVSSALVGMVTGSAIANVAITGAFTIPLMKKVGYRPEQAGAIEAVASVGGQIMPPVMGAQAFLMAAFTGIAYVDIMVAAFLPAILYYIAIALYVEFQARKLNIPHSTEKIDTKAMLTGMPCFLIPIGLLVYLLASGYTPMFCAFWTTLSVITINLLTDLILLRRLKVMKLVEGLTVGATGGAQIGVTSAVIGFLMASVTMTGLGVKLSGMVADLSGGVLLIALLITMVVSLIFGMGVPTMVAYALVAFMVAPALTRMGVPLMEAHFFCMFFAVFSNLTPPVALAALVGSKIAGADYFRTAFVAFKISLVTFILPYILIWNPAVIGKFKSLSSGVASLMSILLLLLAIAIVMCGYYIRKINMLQMCIAALSGIPLLVYVFTLNLVFIVIGAAMLVFLTIQQWHQHSSS